MFKLGTIQTLEVDHLSKIGPFLADPQDPSNKRPTVLLPKKEMPRNLQRGDALDVFIYKDSDDRPIATLRTPKILLGEMRPLKVAALTKIGAFLDWGLEKDLLLPYHEQTVKVQIGREYLVALYLDKSERFCATMKVYNRLEANSPYQEGDWVSGYVYQINPGIGAFLAVDYRYHGMIPRKELTPDIKNGRVVKARVSEVRKRDSRLVLSLNKKSYKEINPDGALILRRLKEADGFLPYHDKTPPAVIKQNFGISKAAFKRAIGHLQKRGKIKISQSGIALCKTAAPRKAAAGRRRLR